MIPAIFLIVASLLALEADPPQLERILIPIYVEGEIPGAHGSIWATELSVVALGNESVIVAGYDTGCRITCPPEGIAPGRTFYPSLFETALDGAFLSSDRPESLVIELRVRDLSRQAEDWGTEVPVVRETQAPLGRFSLLDLPSHPDHRLMLRLYHFSTDKNVAIRLRYFATPRRSVPDTPDALLHEETVTVPAASLQKPGYLALSDLGERVPIFEAGRRIRIEATTLDDGIRIWGMVTVTNNATQHVTAITP